MIRADRHTLWSEAASDLRVDREHLLDMERCARRNPHHDAVTRGDRRRGPGHRNREIELPVPRIELALLDAVGENVVTGRIRTVEPDAPYDFEAVFPDEGNEVVRRIVVGDQDHIGLRIEAQLVGPTYSRRL